MWPTDEIGATQTEDVALLARAKQTVFGLNKYQAKPWANVNGFCLSWPPAVRVSGQDDAVTLVDAFAGGIKAAAGNNGCVQNKGGMLEDIGATVAINDLYVHPASGGCYGWLLLDVHPVSDLDRPLLCDTPCLSSSTGEAV